MLITDEIIFKITINQLHTILLNLYSAIGRVNTNRRACVLCMHFALRNSNLYIILF